MTLGNFTQAKVIKIWIGAWQVVTDNISKKGESKNPNDNESQPELILWSSRVFKVEYKNVSYYANRIQEEEYRHGNTWFEEHVKVTKNGMDGSKSKAIMQNNLENGWSHDNINHDRKKLVY